MKIKSLNHLLSKDIEVCLVIIEQGKTIKLGLYSFYNKFYRYGRDLQYLDYSRESIAKLFFILKYQAKLKVTYRNFNKNPHNREPIVTFKHVSTITRPSELIKLLGLKQNNARITKQEKVIQDSVLALIVLLGLLICALVLFFKTILL